MKPLEERKKDRAARMHQVQAETAMSDAARAELQPQAVAEVEVKNATAEAAAVGAAAGAAAASAAKKADAVKKADASKPNPFGGKKK